MSTVPVVPAIIPTSEAHIQEAAAALSFSPEFQLDLVDGQFVSTVSWPYEPVGDPQAVAQALALYTLEVDLMVREQLVAARAWEAAGADMIVFHIEGIELEPFRNFANETALSVGVSAHGQTSIDELARYAEYADYIQLMGIYEIGAQGLPFDEGVLAKIEELKRRFPRMPISIDGSVNSETIERLRAVGADRFICGSAIVQQPDPEAAWRALCALVNG